MTTLFLLLLIIQLINIDSRSFYAYSYDEILLKLEKWQSEYGDIFQLYTAKEKYNINFNENDKAKCSEQHGTCQHHIIIITNHETWNNDLSRPHVFFSGALHGNEIVGPSTLIELCDYILFEYKNKNNHWINYLINNRVIILTPMTNSHGYAVSTRTELKIDPNRDFPYMISDATECMKTLTARVVNEIFREYLIQLAITFHGGMRAISYEWGAPNHGTPRDLSPDHMAQFQMAKNMQILGGRMLFKSSAGRPYYPIGTLNSVVYPVKGGMEDWAYGGSWDTKNVIQCKPKTHGGYPANKTVYNNAMLRAFNFLIEASDAKIPKSKWGSIKNNWNDIWNIDVAEYDGHISRNVRISLFLINSVAPYVIIDKYPNIIPYNPIKNVFSDERKKLKSINWFVSGVMSIYEYDLMFAMKNKDNIEWNVLEFRKNPMWRRSLDLQKGSVYHSSTIFKFAIDVETKLTVELMKQMVLKCQETNNLIKENENKIYCPIWFSIRVRVDDQWKNNKDDKYKKVQTWPEGMGPQSHVVNARNMDASEWNMSNGKYYVKASKWWYAMEKININIYFIYDDKNKDVKTEYTDLEENQTQQTEEKQEDTNGINIYVVLMLCSIGIIGFICYKRRKNTQRRIYNNKSYQRVSTNISIV